MPRPQITRRDLQDALSALRGERERLFQLGTDATPSRRQAVLAARAGALREAKRLSGVIARFEATMEALS